MTGYILSTELKIILDEYSKLVKDKVAAKIDYKVWRALIEASQTNSVYGWGSCGDAVRLDIEPESVVVGYNQKFVDMITKRAETVKVDTALSDAFTTVGETCVSLNSSLKDWQATTTATLTQPIDLATTTAVISGYYDNKLTTTGSIAYDNRSTLTVPIDSLNLTIRSDDVRLYEFKNGEYIRIGKEKENMNMFKNFSFGPVDTDSVKMSMYGLCVKNKAGTYVAYDTKSGDMMDVDILNFSGKNFLYQIPVALDQITEGTIIIHNRVPMFVVNVPKDRKSLDVIDPYAGERKEILPARSPFGFDFVTRIVSLFDQFAGSSKADASNPFGNMLPLLMLSENPKSENDMLPLMLMMGGNIDPMMAMVMMNGDNKGMLLPMMLMMNQKQGCNCGGQCGGSHN